MDARLTSDRSHCRLQSHLIAGDRPQRVAIVSVWQRKQGKADLFIGPINKELHTPVRYISRGLARAVH